MTVLLNYSSKQSSDLTYNEVVRVRVRVVCCTLLQLLDHVNCKLLYV